MERRRLLIISLSLFIITISFHNQSKAVKAKKTIDYHYFFVCFIGMVSTRTDAYCEMINLVRKGRLHAGLYQRAVVEKYNRDKQSYISKIKLCEVRLDIVDYYRIIKIVGVTNDEILKCFEKYL